MDRVGGLAARALSGGKRRTPHFRI
ncbi:MAG: hypothetical protein JWM85_3469, partial [Acidimicrobiaceae bacterium]|nr:hypothetical protein [Acidimicrobiaceae bacterium]